MAAVQLDLAVCSGLHLESSYTWRLFGKFTWSALGLHLECTWTSLGTTLEAFKGLQKPSKASKKPSKSSLARPSKAFKGFERPSKASTGLQRPHFEGLQRPGKAFEGLQRPSKVSKGLRRPHLEGLRRPSKAPGCTCSPAEGFQGRPEGQQLGFQEFRRSKSSQNERVSTVFSLPAPW